MDVPAAGSEQIEDSKDTEEKRNTEEMTELEETERTAASEGAAEPEKVYSNGYSGGGETLALILEKSRNCLLQRSCAAPNGMEYMNR